MAQAVAAAAIVSAAVTVYSAVEQKSAARRAANIAEDDARAAEQKASYDEQRHRESVQRFLAAQKALYGKAGIQLKGSPLLVLEDTQRQGELDALAIRMGGDVQASRFRSEANLLRQKGQTALIAGIGRAGSSLLSSKAFKQNG